MNIRLRILLKEAFLTQATQEQTASSGMEEGFTGGHQVLVILAQTAALIGPGKGAYHPMAGQELDAGGPIIGSLQERSATRQPSPTATG